METVEVKIYFWIDGEWVEADDVLQHPAPEWEYGIDAAGPTDLLASTGFLTFTLDNSKG